MNAYKKIVKKYYKRIPHGHNPDSRLTKDVFSRAAISVALSKFASDSEIGRALGKSRHSIIYYRNTHEGNMYSEEYKDCYNTALEVVQEELINQNMNEEEQQTYMNALWISINRHLEDGEELYASCLLSNYNAKLNLGWPQSNRQ